MRQPMAHAGGKTDPARTHARQPSRGPAPRGPAAALLGLQRILGNRATSRIIQRCRDGHI